jgi:hypothetical protein
LRKHHKVTVADVGKLKKIGYVIYGHGNKSLEDFLNEVFPNFNILSLVEVVEKSFNSTTTATIERSIEFNGTSKKLVLNYNNDADNIDDALVFVRQFSKISRSIVIEHKYCIIPKGFRGQGLIKPVFQESLQQYINCDARKIIVHAALSDGGYTWAKYGFRAIDREEMTVILHKARTVLDTKEFRDCEKIFYGYYTKNPTGKSFPINLWAAFDFMKPVLRESVWHGELDLKNELHLNKFREYVYR